MLTVKLMKGHTVKIIEATEVNIYPAGAPDTNSSDPQSKPHNTNRVREVAGTSWDGKTFAFYISDEAHPLGFASEVAMWDCAYIENAHGATTERVHAY